LSQRKGLRKKGVYTALQRRRRKKDFLTVVYYARPYLGRMEIQEREKSAGKGGKKIQMKRDSSGGAADWVTKRGRLGMANNKIVIGATRGKKKTVAVTGS